MINKDVVYIVSLILIIINCIIYDKELPNYTKTIYFHILFLICTLAILHENIYLGFFLGVTYLNIN